MDAEQITNYEHGLKGTCHGVLFCRRGPDDPHVMIQLLVEDDGNWFTSDSGFSSYWLPEYIELMQEALKWLEANCDKDPDGYGWVFRD